MENEVDRLVQIIWDYMYMNHTITPSDCILVFGSRDLSVADRACDLFLQGYAKTIVFSGDHGYGPIRVLAKPEAEVYRDIALKRGISKENIYIENKSRNTGENLEFSKELILRENIPHKQVIVVQKPYMERRMYAVFKKMWPELNIIVTSQKISYKDYVKDNPYYTKEKIIDTIVGDLQRMKEYPKLGFQIEQEIPTEVWEAYEELVKLGYDKRLIK